MERVQDSIDKCWRRARNRNLPKCDKIEIYCHCRNCPEFILAGRKLLNREIPTEFQASWTAELAKEKPKEVKDTVSVIVFRVSDEWFALKTLMFQEIIAMRTIHKVPGRSNLEFHGLVNIKGRLLPCLAVDQILGLSVMCEETASGRMVVLDKDGESYLFIVDEIQGITRVTADEIKDVPSTLSKSTVSFSRGVFKSQSFSVALLDEEKFFPALKRSLIA